MAHPIPAPHAAVSFRSSRRLDRTLLMIALAAIIALTAAVVIATNDNDQVSSATKATPAVAAVAHQPQPQAGTRYDGGPDEGTRGAVFSPPVADSRYDGGPEEGTRGPQQLQFKERAGGPTMVPQGPGAR